MKKVLVMIAVLLLVVAMPVCAFAVPYDNEFNEDEINTCFIFMTIPFIFGGFSVKINKPIKKNH